MNLEIIAQDNNLCGEAALWDAARLRPEIQGKLEHQANFRWA